MSSKKQKPIYRTVLIGAGRIASGFDTPHSPLVLTHAHALVKHPRFTLVGMTDTDAVRGAKEARKWRTTFYADTDTMLKETKPDMVIIATPDDTHADLLLKVSRTRPLMIICEKPVGVSKKEVNMLEQKVLPLNIPTIINYSRRFDPTVVKVRDELWLGRYGKVISANGIYTNGVLHNGAHLIDLGRFFFGEMIKGKGFFKVLDHDEKEGSIGGAATFERCPQFSIMTGDERQYSVFEFEIFTEKKRLRFRDFGFELVMQNVIPDPILKGYRGLSEPRMIKTKLPHALSNLLDNAAGVMDGEEKELSPLAEGIKTQYACFKLLASTVSL